MNSPPRRRLPALAAFAAAGLALAGCGTTGSTGDSGNMLARLFSPGKQEPAPVAPSPDDVVDYCPEVDIADGGAALRQMAGDTVRNQISIQHVARECQGTSGGGYTIKIGAEGRVLLGPAGAPGTFNAPVRFTVKRGDTVIASRQRSVPVQVPAGEAGANFAVVEEPIEVPPGDGEVIVEVGLGSPAAATSPRRKRR